MASASAASSCTAWGEATGAAAIVVAAPVASPQAAQLLAAEADELVILQVPAMLFAIGEWYARFEQLEDGEVCQLLELYRRSRRESDAPDQARR